MNLQCRSSLLTELAVEYENGLPGTISAQGWRRLCDALSEQEVLDTVGGVDVDCAWDVSAVVLIVEAAVDHVEVLYLGVVLTVKKRVEL